MPILTPETFANFGASSIQGGAGGAGTLLNAGDSSVLLQPGDGTKFPSVGPFRILIGTATGANEIAIATANSSDILSGLIRGAAVDEPQLQTAQTWGLGTPVQQVATAGTLTRLEGLLASNYLVRASGGDDTANVLAALDACRVAGGGTVFCPDPLYLFTTSMTHRVQSAFTCSLEIGSNTRLLGGGGPGGTVFRGGASMPNQWYLLLNRNPGGSGGDQDIVIENITPECNAANNTPGTVDAAYRLALNPVRRPNLPY